MTTKASGKINYYNSDGGPVLRTVTAKDVAALERAYRVASAIMRTTERTAVLPRLLRDWEAAAQALEAAKDTK